MRRMLALVACIACGVLAACAMSSGILPYGPDTYTISEVRAPVRGGSTAAKQAAIAEATQYCQSMGAALTPINGRESGANPFGPTNYEMTFRCSKAISLDAAAAQARAVEEECKSKRIAGVLKTYVESVKCSNQGIHDAWSAAQYPYMDLINQILAHRLVVAERIDRGTLTEAEGLADQAEFDSKMVATARERTMTAAESTSRVRANDAAVNAASAMSNAASAQAEAARVNAWAGVAALGQQIANPRPAVTCTTFGPTTTCR